MSKTSKLYTQIVTNAPLACMLPNHSTALGRRMKGRCRVLGFFANATEYDKATRAYQLLADRYSQRVGDAPERIKRS